MVVYHLSFFVKKLCHCLANHWLKLWTPFQSSQKSIKNIILSFLFLEMKRFDRSNGPHLRFQSLRNQMAKVSFRVKFTKNKKAIGCISPFIFCKKLCHCLANHWLKLWTPFQSSQKSIKNIILSFLFLEMKRFDRSNV